MSIAVFGGSFDPPHLGHELIANKVVDTLAINKLIIVPTFLNPFKNSSSLDASVRFELVKEVFKDNPKIEVSSYEIEQQKKVPTIDTIKYLKAQGYGKIFLIIGADNLEKLHLWQNYKELGNLVEFVVVTRNDIKIDNFQTINIDCDISSTRIRENLDITLIPNKIQEKVKKLWKKE